MTAQLVQLYDKAGTDRKFEMVFFGHDKDHDTMLKYLKKSKATFPAVKMDQVDSVKNLFDLGNDGFVPCVVLASPEGEIIANKPEAVIAELNKLVEG